MNVIISCYFIENFNVKKTGISFVQGSLHRGKKRLDDSGIICTCNNSLEYNDENFDFKCVEWFLGREL